MPWFIKTKDSEHGPVSSAKLKEYVSTGKLQERTLLRRDGQVNWIPAGSVQGLFSDRPAETEETPVETGPSIASSVMSTMTGFGKSLGNLIPAGSKATPPDENTQRTPIVVQVDPILSQLTLDSQPSSVIEKILPKVRELLTETEQIQYIAVQSKPMVIFPDCVVLTSRRFMIVRPKMLGRLSFEDFIWRDLRNAQVEDNILGATIRFDIVGGGSISLDYLPKSQAKAIYRYAQQREEEALEERRNRKMEESRAGASQMVIQTAVQSPISPLPPVANSSPLERMQQLKQFLDAGLISQQEFDVKKAEILNSI